MAIIKTRFKKGIILTPDNISLEGIAGELKVNLSGKLQAYLDSATREIVTADQEQTLENKTLTSPVINGSITGDVLEADLSVSAGDDKLVSASVIKAFVDSRISDKDQASEISYDNTTSELTALNVQDAIDEVENRLDTSETGLSDHISQLVDAHDASSISVIPNGNLESDTVQDSLEELQQDIDTRALNSDLTTHTSSYIEHGVTSNLVGEDDTQVLTNKTIDVDLNTLSNIETDNLKAGVLNTASDLSEATDTQIPSALAVKSYADSVLDTIISQEVSFTIVNNQTTPADITSLSFSPSTFRAIKIDYTIYRQSDTASSGVAQIGQLRFVFNTQSSSWLLSDDFAGQDSGVTFSIDNTTGQVKYTSTDISGTNYVGTLKYNITKTFTI